MSKITLRNGSTGHELTHIGPGGLLTEGLDGEQTLKFTVLPDDVGYIDFTTRVEFEGQYYDPVKILKYGNALGAFADVEAEHVSYRLNEYTHGQISLNGTYSQILARCLNGTDLTPGTCISGTLQGGVMENVTAREALMTAAGYMGGELSFNGFTVSIVAHRGNSTRANIMDTGSVVSVEVDKAKGETESSYRIGLGRRGSLAVGDEIRLVYAPFSLDVNTRIIKMRRNPYNSNDAKIEVGRHVPEITDSFVQAQVKSAEEIELAKGMASNAQEIAEEVAQDMVDRNTKGYITFQTDANGGTEAIYFSATKPITGAVRYWKWSMNGLAYTSDAGSTWSVGITADGKIMGDRIAAGTISANAIDTDTLRVKDVWYNGTYEQYRMLRAEISGGATWTNVGPEELDNGFNQVLNCYGKVIYFKTPGVEYDVGVDHGVLAFEMDNYVISPRRDDAWSIGTSTYPFDTIVAKLFMIWQSEYSSGDLRIDSRGNLIYTAPNGISYDVAGPDV